MAASAVWGTQPSGREDEQVRLEVAGRHLRGDVCGGRRIEGNFFPLGNSALHVGLGVVWGEILITAKALRY